MVRNNDLVGWLQGHLIRGDLIIVNVWRLLIFLLGLSLLTKDVLLLRGVAGRVAGKLVELYVALSRVSGRHAS